MHLGSQSRRRRSCRGGAAVELAVLLPILIMVLLGGVDFGRAFFQAVAVRNAAAAAAQYAVYRASNTKDTAGIEQVALNELSDTAAGEPITVAVQRFCTCANGSSVDCDSGTCDSTSGPRRTYIRVRVAQPFVTLFDYPGVPHTLPLAQEVYMRAR
jgi:Flp pilus assembly protein TadG